MIGIVATMILTCILLILWKTLPSTKPNNVENTFNPAYIERFFDKDRVINIHVKLSETDFEDMLQNPKKEEYKQADIIIDGEKVNNVGFRIKGNSSLNMVANTNSNRFSFKIDFDQYIGGQSLAGLTKLNLNNSIADPSYMREYLSYSLLEEMGVPTPAFCYANVYVNDELIGLYLALEGIEEPFLQRYYGNNYGTLYKPYGEHGKGTDLVYIDDNIESYSDLKPVTKRKNGSNEALINMLKMLHEGSNLEKCLDIDEILRYFAINTILVNMDSYQGPFSHNYYLYDNNGIFSLLPWDYNMSFGGFSMRGGGQDPTSLYIDQPVSGTNLKQRPLLGKLLEIDEYKEKYHQYIDEFINGPFALDKMTNEIEEIADMIRPHLEKDPTKFYNMEQFEQAIKEGTSQPNKQVFPMPNVASIPPVQDRKINNQQLDDANRIMQGSNTIGLLKFTRERIKNVAQQLSGELPSVGNTTPSQFDDFMHAPRGGQQPPPPDGLDHNRPNRNRATEEFTNNMKDMAKSRMQQTNSIYLYLIGCSIVLLIVTTLIIFKKRNKYSI